MIKKRKGMERRKGQDRRGEMGVDKKEEKHKGRRRRGNGGEGKERKGMKRKGRKGCQYKALGDKSVKCLLSFALKLLKNRR